MIIGELKEILEEARTVETSLKITPKSSSVRKSYIIPSGLHKDTISILSKRYDKVVPFYNKIYKDGKTGVAIGVDMNTNSVELYLDTAWVVGRGYSLELDSSTVNIYYIEKKDVAYKLMNMFLPKYIFNAINCILSEKNVCCTLNKVKNTDNFNFYIRPLNEIKMHKLKKKLLDLIRYINSEELSNVDKFINQYKNNALNWLGITLTKEGVINVKIYTVNIFSKHP